MTLTSWFISLDIAAGFGNRGLKVRAWADPGTHQSSPCKKGLIEQHVGPQSHLERMCHDSLPTWPQTVERHSCWVCNITHRLMLGLLVANFFVTNALSPEHDDTQDSGCEPESWSLCFYTPTIHPEHLPTKTDPAFAPENVFSQHNSVCNYISQHSIIVKTN